MKTIKILALIICVNLSLNINAQSNKKEVLKVKYTSGCVSEFMVGMMKKQIQDPQKLSSFLKMMGDYKVHSTYYINTKTKESLFVLDSVSEVKNLSTTGYTFYVLKNKSGEIKGKENFMGKDIFFEEKSNNIKWEFTADQKEINGYQCKKAHLKGNPEIYAWFTPQIPVNGGPYTFFGLPGLVLETNSPFESINTNTISYCTADEFNNKYKEVDARDKKAKSIPLSKVHVKKENFQRMISKG